MHTLSSGISVAVKSLTRSMGHPDLYHFVLAAPVIEELRFVHGLSHKIGMALQLEDAFKYLVDAPQLNEKQ